MNDALFRNIWRGIQARALVELLASITGYRELFTTCQVPVKVNRDSQRLMKLLGWNADTLKALEWCCHYGRDGGGMDRKDDVTEGPVDITDMGVG